MRSLLPLLASIAWAAPALAAEHDPQLWTASTAEFDLGGDVGAAAQFVARFGDDANGPSELQYQADLSWEAQPGLVLDAGYSHVVRYQDGDVTTREHRVRQQVAVGLGEALGGKIEARARLEQRWRDDSDDTLHRLRTRLAWSRPIGPDGLSLRLWSEGFFHLNDTDWGREARFARVRSQVSLRRKFGDALTGEVGYLHQYDRARGREDAFVHALSLAFSYGF